MKWNKINSLGDHSSFEKIKTRMNFKLYHEFVFECSSQDKLWQYICRDELLFQFCAIYCRKKELKREKFSENNNEADIFNFRNAFEHYFEQRFFVHFKLLISFLLLFADSIEIFHEVSFTNRWTDEKTKLNFETIFS